MLFYLLMGAVVIAIAGMVYGVSMMFTVDDEQVNQRLEVFTSNHGRGVMPAETNTSVLKSPLDDAPNELEQFFARFLNLPLFIEQSGLNLTVSKFLAISAISGAGMAITTAPST